MKRNLNAIVIFVVFVTLVLALADAAFAQTTGFVEVYNTVTATSTTPQVDVYAKGPLKGDFGWTAWSLSSKGWSEGLLGLTYTPAGWIELSGSLGVETDNNPLRGGASLWMGKGRFSFLALEEQGGSGRWYRYLGTVEVTRALSVGVNSTCFLGTGPYAELKIGKASLWSTYALGEKRGVIAAKLNF